MAQEVRQPLIDETLRPPLRLGLLLLVVQHGPDGMMRLMHLVRQAVQDGQHQRIEVIDAIALRRSQAQLRREVEQDVGRLIDD